MGLAHRYGRRMQAISGIHYNWSLPGVGNGEYFALLRNFRRHGWLLFYLLGASPAVCSSFVAGRKHALKELRSGTLYLPHATTLRMGRLGYQSDAQASIAASFNSLEDYGASLEKALLEPWPAYEKIGVRGANGDYRQLGTALLQIENEFYGKIRPKRPIRSGERPLHALRERGVEYVEVRLVDLDPFQPVGIDTQAMRLLDVVLLHCLLADSPRDTPEEIAADARNQEKVASRGREPGLELERGGNNVPLAAWGAELLAACEPVAGALDRAFGGGAYRAALAHARGMLAEPESTPSARVLAEMAKKHDNSYTRFALERSRQHARTLRSTPLEPELAERFVQMADASHRRQREIEATDKLDFEAWRQNYLSPAQLRVQRN
jgi:glutamate--cysteine ligase